MVSPDLAELLDNPALATFMVMASIGGMFMTVSSLRNADLWLLRIRGCRASGVVQSIELLTTPNGEVRRRPVVAFSTGEGVAVLATPALFRPNSRLARGPP